MKKLKISKQIKKPADSEAITFLGKHVLAEFFDCNPNVLNNVSLIEQLMNDAAAKCGATIIDKKFHLFSPYGVSGVIIISESHLTIHTWPEHGYAAVDLFTCGDTTNPVVAYEYLKEGLSSGTSSYSELKRGMMLPKSREMVKASFVTEK